MKQHLVRLLLAAAFALAALACEAQDARDFLANPGFEDGDDFGPWRAHGTAAHIFVRPWHPHEGARAAGLGNDQGPADAFGILEQEARLPDDTRPGDLLVFRAWAKSEERYSGRASVALEFRGAENRLLATAESPAQVGHFEWTLLTAAAAVPPGTDRVLVQCRSTGMASGRGASFVWFDQAQLDCLRVASSSHDPEFPSRCGKAAAWHSVLSGDQWVEFDYRIARPLSGLVLDWTEDYPQQYEISASLDGQRWEPLFVAEKAASGCDTIYLPERPARFVRVVCRKSATGLGFGLQDIRWLGPADALTPRRYLEIVAAQHPARFPRWMNRQQAYWTLVGVPEDEREALLCEDGALEPHARGFSITPFLYVNGRFVTRDDAEITQALEQRCLPLPTVTWKVGDLEMEIALLAAGEAGRSVAYARYRVTNRGASDSSGRLFLALRPYQVYPPWQGGGGWSSIQTLTYSNGTLTINETWRVIPLTPADGVGSLAGTDYFRPPFKVPGPPDLEGDISSWLARGALPEPVEVSDTNGLASCALAFDFGLAPGASDEFYLALPLHDAPPALEPGMPKDALRAAYDAWWKDAAAFWSQQVSRIELDVPEPVVADMLKANIAFTLITRDGPGFQPGSRSYDKTWMRDGGMSAAAMLRMGFTREIREFLDWYATFQQESGEVPPIIDTKADDPLWEEKEKGLIEYDSQGEFVYTILQYYRFTGDRAWLEGKLTNVVKALEFLAYLRKQTMTPEFRDGPPEKRKYHGILPPSTSHEGYYREYSYWDDFWALRGWKDGRAIFQILGRDDLAAWAQKEYEAFKTCFYESMRLTMETAGIDFIPGSASLADFDATSTAVALMYADEMENLPQPELRNTFDRYYQELRGRSAPGAAWRIVPYELRSVPAFLFMGQKGRALELLRFMMGCRRPAAWLQLAEVVHSDYRFPTYIGDMPHTWAGAEFLFAVRSLFVYEKGGMLVLGAGVDPAWLKEGQPVRASRFPTEHGEINIEITKRGWEVLVRVEGSAAPPGGFVLKSPLDEAPAAASVNGSPARIEDGGVRFGALPAEVVFAYGRPPR